MDLSELMILFMASYHDKLNQENYHSVFVSLNMISLCSTLFLFHLAFLLISLLLIIMKNISFVYSH